MIWETSTWRKGEWNAPNRKHKFETLGKQSHINKWEITEQHCVPAHSY